MTTRNSTRNRYPNMWATPVKAPDSIKAGYAYEYVGRDWKRSPDDEWEQVVVEGGPSLYIGSRTLGGARTLSFWARTGSTSPRGCST